MGLLWGEVASTTDFEASLLSQNSYLSFNVPISLGQSLNGFQFGSNSGSNYLANTRGFTGVTYTLAAAPEPSSLILALLGLLGFIGMLRKSKAACARQ